MIGSDRFKSKNMEWFALIIPVLAVGCLYAFFKSRVLWWETAIVLATVTAFILITRFTMKTFAYSDIEWWTSPIVTATYYEPWNEYIHRTCSRSCCCDSKGQNCSTETYDCSYVDYHSAYWEIEDETGQTVRITETEWNRLVDRFGGKQFVDMHRDYHTEDGDAWVATWSGDDATLEACVTEHRYENRVASTNTVFSYRSIDDSTRKKEGLFDYTSVYDRYRQRTFLYRTKIADTDSTERALDILNSRLGPNRQLKVWLLLWKGGTIQTGIDQEHLWKGGNKNEMVITVGIDGTGKAIWCHPFSWTDKHDNEIRIRDWILSQSTFDGTETVQFMRKDLITFERKAFADFSYLTADLTTTQIVWIYILTMIITAGVCWWVVQNEFDDRFDQFKKRNIW